MNDSESSPASKEPFQKLHVIVGSVILLSLVAAIVFGKEAYAYVRFLTLKNTNTTDLYQTALSSRPQSAQLSADARRENGASLLIDPRIDGKNYWTSTSRVTAGPQAASCGVYFAYDPAAVKEYTMESASFFSDDAQYFGKFVTTIADEDVIDYSVTTPDAFIQYRGGAYAIRTEGLMAPVTTLRSADAESEEVTASDTPMQDDKTVTSNVYEPKLVGVEFIGTREYYVYETTYDLYCDGDETVTAVQKQWIDPATQTLFKEATYIGAVSADRLMMTTEMTFESREAELGSVQGEFGFDLDVTIRDVTVLDETSIMREFLSGTTLGVLVPTATEWQLTSTYSMSAQTQHYESSYNFDREFYAPGALGDTQFENATVNHGIVGPQSLLDVYFSNASSTSVNISIVDSSWSKSEALGMILSSTDQENKEDGSITIESQLQLVEVYTVNPMRTEPGLAAGDSGSGEKISEGIPTTIAPGSGSQNILYFERNSRHYIIRIDNFLQSDFEWSTSLNQYTELSMQNDVEQQAFFALLEAAAPRPEALQESVE